MPYPTDLKYTKDHEWIQMSGETAAIGVTDFAQRQLGDVVYLDLPEVGRRVTAGETFGSIESVKAVSDLFAPMSGEVVEVNEALKGAPESVNQSPHDSWMIKIRLTAPAEAATLLDVAQYESLVG
jgi:glycine cleavage system H protein